MIQTSFTCQLTNLKKSLPILKESHIDDKVIQAVLSSAKFKNYIAKIDSAPSSIEVSQIELVSVQMFSKGVGFINARIKTKDHGQALPSYVFIRGAAVGVLLLINGKMLLVKQYRVPLQQYTLQCPAGMLDQQGDFSGVAAKQIEQETGIQITKQKLVQLIEMISSGGASDQTIVLYSCEIQVSQEKLDQILNKIHGSGQHERIQLQLVDFTTQNVLKTKDSKLIAATLAYHNLKKTSKA